MTLDHFISLKPKELRLGQWFVNCYCKPVGQNWEDSINKLWNLDGEKAIACIKNRMWLWQWDDLPDTFV